MTPQQAIDALTRIKARLQKGWIKGRIAENEYGEGVSPEDPRAIVWCLKGAILAETQTVEEYQNCSIILRRGMPPQYSSWNLTAFNDCPYVGLKDVLALVDRAIAAEEKKLT